MKKLVIACYLLLCAVFAGAQATAQPKAFSFSTERLQEGQDVTLTYRPELTSLKGESNIQGVVYYWKNYHWEAVDLNMVKDGDAWKSTFKVPMDASLSIYKFTANGKKDIGEPAVAPYASFILDKDMREKPSASTGWALLRGQSSQEYGAAIPDLLNKDSKLIDDEVLLYWYNRELQLFPNERKNIFWYALKTGEHKTPGYAAKRLPTEYEYLSQLDEKEPLAEEIWLKALDLAKNVCQNDSLTKVIEARVLARYPDGILARDKEIWRIFNVMDPAEKEKQFDVFVKRFPPEKFMNVKTENTDMWYGKIFQSVTYYQVIKHNNYDLMMKYLPVLPYIYLTTFYWHMVQIPHQNKLVKSDFILPYATAIYNEKMKRERTTSELCYSPREWKESKYRDWKDAILVQAQLKSECGDDKGAMALLDTIAPYFGAKSANFNNYYVQMLNKNGRSNEVLTFIKDGVKENAASPEMLEILKKDYVANNGSEKGFDSYLNKMKSSELVAAQKKDVLKSLEKKPIKLFSVEALDGHRIDMAKLKGKIIVLDFWATWCAPCKAAMPGMQMAVNKYKNDKNVVFLFVSTMENDKNFRDKIKAFIKEKGYTFQVVLDNPNPQTKLRDAIYSSYGKTFHFSGIPQKMIIDGNGNLRWRALGYYGSPSALADEISYVIDYLKTGK
jgi:thiol-disulfide isomerase/thioredoxin